MPQVVPPFFPESGLSGQIKLGTFMGYVIEIGNWLGCGEIWLYSSKWIVREKFSAGLFTLTMDLEDSSMGVRRARRDWFRDAKASTLGRGTAPKAFRICYGAGPERRSTVRVEMNLVRDARAVLRKDIYTRLHYFWLEQKFPTDRIVMEWDLVEI